MCVRKNTTRPVQVLQQFPSYHVFGCLVSRKQWRDERRKRWGSFNMTKGAAGLDVALERAGLLPWMRWSWGLVGLQDPLLWFCPPWAVLLLPAHGEILLPLKNALLLLFQQGAESTLGEAKALCTFVLLHEEVECHSCDFNPLYVDTILWVAKFRNLFQSPNWDD